MWLGLNFRGLREKVKVTWEVGAYCGDHETTACCDFMFAPTFRLNYDWCHRLVYPLSFHSIEVAPFLFARWRVWAHCTRAIGLTRLVPFVSSRAPAVGQNYKRVTVLRLFGVSFNVAFCITFSFVLRFVLFVIKFIKYNDWFFPSWGRKWTTHRVEREMRHNRYT